MHEQVGGFSSYLESTCRWTELKYSLCDIPEIHLDLLLSCFGQLALGVPSEVEVVWELQETWWLSLLCRSLPGGCGPSLPACSQGWFGVLWKILNFFGIKAVLKEKIKEREERWLPAFSP